MYLRLFGNKLALDLRGCPGHLLRLLSAARPAASCHPAAAAPRCCRSFPHHLSFSTSTVTSSVLQVGKTRGTGGVHKRCAPLVGSVCRMSACRRTATCIAARPHAPSACKRPMHLPHHVAAWRVGTLHVRAQDNETARAASCAPALGHGRLCQLSSDGVAGLGGHALARVHHVSVAAAAGVGGPP